MTKESSGGLDESDQEAIVDVNAAEVFGVQVPELLDVPNEVPELVGGEDGGGLVEEEAVDAWVPRAGEIAPRGARVEARPGGLDLSMASDHGISSEDEAVF